MEIILKEIARREEIINSREAKLKEIELKEEELSKLKEEVSIDITNLPAEIEALKSYLKNEEESNNEEMQENLETPMGE